MFDWRIKQAARGRSSMVERQLPKLHTRVRFPSPAPIQSGPSKPAEHRIFRLAPPRQKWEVRQRCCPLRKIISLSAVLQSRRRGPIDLDEPQLLYPYLVDVGVVCCCGMPPKSIAYNKSLFGCPSRRERAIWTLTYGFASRLGDPANVQSQRAFKPVLGFSLLKQTAPPRTFEIIVVDNACRDDTTAVVADLKNKNPQFDITYVQEKRAGLVYARHAGVLLAKYPVLLFGDDDGVYGRRWVSEIARFYLVHPGVSAVGGKITIRWDRPPPAWVYDYEHILGKLDYGSEIAARDNLYINGGNFSIKKDALLHVGGFNPDQVGEYLIGDGELGLCRKLHRANLHIGWSPNAEMEHLQFVSKNASKRDMKRRFRNNGIAEGYEDLIVVGKARRALALRMILPFFWNFVACKYRMIACIAARDASSALRNSFESAACEAKAAYALKVALFSSFHRQVSKTDWF